MTAEKIAAPPPLRTAPKLIQPIKSRILTGVRVAKRAVGYFLGLLTGSSDDAFLPRAFWACLFKKRSLALRSRVVGRYFDAMPSKPPSLAPPCNHNFHAEIAEARIPFSFGAL